ncbi:MAG TPA: hypothetical protein VMC62_12665 [Longilinea sp.]|nr:hypothetical protein [Longilinea sp.]
MKKLFVWVLVAVLLASCNSQAMPGKLLLAQSPQAWIDAPLDGSTIPPAPYQVVFHGSDPGTVVQGELSVNDKVQASLVNTDTSSHLVVFRVDWNPPSPGKYTLKVRALDGSNTWSNYAVANVTVSENTPTPSPTSTVTATPTITVTPTISEGLVFNNETSPKQVYLGGCSPNQIIFAVTVNQPVQVYDVVVFTRLQDVNSGKLTGWDEGTAMAVEGNGAFRLIMNTKGITGANENTTAYLLYQFVATDTHGQVIGRSQTFEDATLSQCGIIIVPLQLISTPTLIPPPK